MHRAMWLSVFLALAIGSGVRAVVFVLISDDVDDRELIDAVSGQKPVKEFASEMDKLRGVIEVKDSAAIEKLLGKPARKPPNGYAMPVGQPRGFAMSGLRYADKKENKDHTEFYPVGDFAGIVVLYGVDGSSPEAALFYFKVDESFPKLKKIETNRAETSTRPEKKPAVIREHTIDADHWNKLDRGMNKEQVAKVFSAPAGDCAPGTDYLTRSWGSQCGGEGNPQETLEWRSEKGRIVVAFDARGVLLTSEFFLPGHDPVTNIAERLKWDREKFAKVKKYFEERMRAQRSE
jgi:hypothetical protein